MINHTFDQISSCPKCRIREGELFTDHVTPRLRDELSAHLTMRTIQDAEVLFREDDAPQGVFFLDSGRIKLTRRNGDNRVDLVKVMRPGEILGLGATLTMSPHRVTAEAIETSQVRTIGPPEFRLLLRHNAFFLGTIVDYLEGHAHRELTYDGVSPAVPALARYLAHVAHDEGTPCEEGVRIDLPITMRELAILLRVPFDRLTAAMNNLEDRQWLYRRRTTITISDPAALQRVAGPLQASQREGSA